MRLKKLAELIDRDPERVQDAFFERSLLDDFVVRNDCDPAIRMAHFDMRTALGYEGKTEPFEDADQLSGGNDRLLRHTRAPEGRTAF